MHVRGGELGDIPWLKEQLNLFSEFYDTKYKLYDEQHATGALKKIIEEHVLLIAENNEGQQLGFIAGLITPHIFNPKITVLAEVFWWVSEKHRGASRAGLLLFKKLLEIGEQQANWITVSLLPKSNVNERMLTKNGFVLHERNYVKEVVS